MFCPKCRAEYVAGVAVCADCGETLVEKLPPKPQVEYTDLVTVLEAADPALLAVAESILEGAGIKAFALGGAFMTLGYSLSSMPVRLQVRPEDAEAARELLADLDQDTAPREDGGEES